MHFEKWNGCGNDFVLVNAMDGKIDDIVRETVQICDRHFGIGADGIIFALSSDKADIRMRIFNSDGSEAEMCGNGIRCFAKWVRRLGLIKENRFSVETLAGVLYPEIMEDGFVRVNMGAPHLKASEIPVTGMGEGTVINAPLHIESDGHDYHVTCVSMGNPHCIIFTDEVPSTRMLEELGRAIETDPHFPKKTNVEFAKVMDEHTIRMRVWERGAGITMACGTGSCATGVAAMLNHKSGNSVAVIVDGGTLKIDWEGGENPVFLTGPATYVYSGEYKLEER